MHREKTKKDAPTRNSCLLPSRGSILIGRRGLIQPDASGSSLHSTIQESWTWTHRENISAPGMSEGMAIWHFQRPEIRIDPMIPQLWRELPNDTVTSTGTFPLLCPKSLGPVCPNMKLEPTSASKYDTDYAEREPEAPRDHT